MTKDGIFSVFTDAMEQAGSFLQSAYAAVNDEIDTSALGAEGLPSISAHNPEEERAWRKIIPGVFNE